jgi:hypothetical protein
MFGHRNYLIINKSLGPIIIGCCCQRRSAEICAAIWLNYAQLVAKHYYPGDPGTSPVKKTLIIFKYYLVE